MRTTGWLLLAVIALAGVVLWMRNEPGGRAPPDTFPSSDSAPASPKPQPGTRDIGSAGRALLEARLQTVLPEVESPRDRARLAELLLEMREAQSGHEPPAIAGEIQQRIAEEFERIAGEPLGRVTARLADPLDLPPRPPRRSPEPPGP